MSETSNLSSFFKYEFVNEGEILDAFNEMHEE